MKSIRSFIAIELSNDIKNNIGQIVARLTVDNKLAVRWVPLNNIHLTLKFLGDVDYKIIEGLNNNLQKNLNNLEKFEITFKNIGVFPNIDHPKIIWLGVQNSKSLNTAYKVIDDTASKLGIKSENRPFSPHITIGRVKKDITRIETQQIKKPISSVTINTVGTQPVNDITIFKSTLDPHGAVYSPIFKISLHDDNNL